MSFNDFRMENKSELLIHEFRLVDEEMMSICLPRVKKLYKFLEKVYDFKVAYADVLAGTQNIFVGKV